MRPGAWLLIVPAAALAACGHGGEVIDDPLACHFDPSVLRCTAGDSDSCLTDAQLATLAKLYAGPPGYAGLEPGGEAEPGGWAAWVTGTAPGAAAQRRFAVTYFRYLVTGDPHFDIARLRFDREYAPQLAPILDAASPDLAAFARHGKLIVWHGWADPAIPPRDSIGYHDAVAARIGDPSGFYRLFLVPGMLHCEGGRGPSNVPTLEAIEAWVEQGRAPDQLTATRGERTWRLAPYHATSGSAK